MKNIRHGKFLYQVADYTDRLWNVRFERPTNHTWLLLLGRPADLADEQKCCLGGDQVIITHELAAYMESMRLTPSAIDLPVCIATITRLRRVLGLNFNADRTKWWSERCYELTAAQKDIAAAYGVCVGSVGRRSKLCGIIHGSARWSQDEKTLLQQLLDENLSTQEIADKMGKTKGAIKVMRRRLIGNITNTTPWAEEEKTEALRLLADGVNADVVAKRFGRTKIALFAMRSRAIGAISPRKERWLDEEKALLVQMLESGHTDQQIAEALQRTECAVHGMRQRLGLL